MREEDYNWLTQHHHLLGNVRMTPEQVQRVFAIYNAVTGEHKPITSCGRCVHSVKQRLRVEYEIIQSLRNQNG